MGGIPEFFEDRWGVLWCSRALRSDPFRKAREHRKSVHIWMSVKFGITKLWFSPSQTGYPGFDRSRFSKYGPEDAWWHGTAPDEGGRQCGCRVPQRRQPNIN